MPYRFVDALLIAFGALEGRAKVKDAVKVEKTRASQGMPVTEVCLGLNED